ncbi:MAG: APC family permease [Verrucomicrobiota bacterium]
MRSKTTRAPSSSQQPASPDGPGPEPGALGLKPALNLPLLVFYGVGVTIGAGIFALIGEVLRVAGDEAPISFLLAGIVGGVTGMTYAVLVRAYPEAGGVAIYTTRAFGKLAGLVAGLAVALTGIVSSAVIANAFAGYAGTFLNLPAAWLVVAMVLLIGGLVAWGVLESVVAAAVITVLEVGVLLLIVVFGAPLFAGLPEALGEMFTDPVAIPYMQDDFQQATAPAANETPQSGSSTPANPWGGILAGVLLAFFAFIGFEDMVNMAEETKAPRRNLPRAILLTLGITTILYVALSLLSVLVGDRQELVASEAPMAVLFEMVTGWPRQMVAGVAVIALVNGVLVQVLMGSRVLYGMAREGLISPFFGVVHSVRQTPIRAAVAVCALVLILALALPLALLAQITSSLTLVVFAGVHLSLFALGQRSHRRRMRSEVATSSENDNTGECPPATDLLPEEALTRWRWWGVLGAGICVAVLAAQLL